MQTKAALMVLVLLSGTIAGCTSDPDGGGNDGIDSDALDDLFDEYFQDFVNNTSITVNNHYHNNTTYVVDDGDYSTTVVNEYNNTTINEGDETSTNNYNNQTDNDYSSSSLNYSLNGSGGDSIVQVFRITWNMDGRYSVTNFGGRDIVVNGTVQVPGWTGSELSYQYNGNLIKLSFTCEELINAYYYMEDDDWRDWIFDEYGGSWSQAENLGYSMRNDIAEIFGSSYGAREICWDGGSSYPPIKEHNLEYFYSSEYDTESHYTTLFEISLSTGQAVELLSIPNLHNITLECEDGFGSASGNGSLNDNAYIGGQSGCTVSGQALITTSYSYLRTGVSNGSGPSLETPEWYNGGYWFVFTNHEHLNGWDRPYSNTPSDFLVYFTMYFVQVYEHDSE